VVVSQRAIRHHRPAEGRPGGVQSAENVRDGKVDAPQVSPGEVGATQDRTCQVRKAQDHPAEVRIPQVSVNENRTSEVGVGQVSLREIDTGQPCINQIRPRQVGTSQITTRGVRVAQYRACQNGVNQLRAAQVSLPEIDGRQVSIRAVGLRSKHAPVQCLRSPLILCVKRVFNKDISGEFGLKKPLALLSNGHVSLNVFRSECAIVDLDLIDQAVEVLARPLLASDSEIVQAAAIKLLDRAHPFVSVDEESLRVGADDAIFIHDCQVRPFALRGNMPCIRPAPTRIVIVERPSDRAVRESGDVIFDLLVDDRPASDRV
jgi:hypothetical protein